ncbi:hypothetical protein EJ571_02085 [Mycobacteroides franklinii]|uniref:Uncharacterized protein n=1 Tax=Mycobacteroides franklinii TaxID=948102 RepID=A0A4R5PGH8_9MYCO|nr:hypothetical protein EJ571_02085 [Mycobacteroides franklinii]
MRRLLARAVGGSGPWRLRCQSCLPTASLFSKVRAAVRHIREWIGWATHRVLGAPPPPLPLELRDGV